MVFFVTFGYMHPIHILNRRTDIILLIIGDTDTTFIIDAS
jgi:hypothetical protein